PRFLQLANHVDRFHAEDFREKVDFARTEAVDVDRMIALDVAHQIQIPVERDIWVVSALDQNLNATERFDFVDLGADLLEGKRVAFAVLWPTRKGAESAISDADVGVVDVAVDDVGDGVAGMLLLAHATGSHSQLEERRAG